MNKSLLSVAVITGALVSCAEQSSEQQTKKIDKEPIIKKSDFIATEVRNVAKIKKNDEKNIETKALVSNARSTSINGEKFKLFASKNIQGSKVFNVLMQQYGTLKGGIIVVVKGDILKSDSFEQFTLTKIAKNTFRLIPDKGLDLVVEYKKLSEMLKLEVVELEIDYSPINNRAAN